MLFWAFSRFALIRASVVVFESVVSVIDIGGSSPKTRLGSFGYGGGIVLSC